MHSHAGRAIGVVKSARCSPRRLARSTLACQSESCGCSSSSSPSHTPRRPTSKVSGSSREGATAS
eukprot:scaffold90512_cov72-Phaeocystis_antarctica.AAC.5